ncbi:extracellular solute-binding protein [Candidatus Aerophobetes bacterium]|nr:extracellular solute-binding protein [Candidatus Aerophobetes bacterium]
MSCKKLRVVRWKKLRIITIAILFLMAVFVIHGAGMAQVRPRLSVWGRASFAPAQAYWANSFIYEWAAEKGVDVKISWIPVADVTPKLVTAVVAGTEPDIVIGGMPYTKFAELGLLLPLDDVVAKLGKEDIFDIKLQAGIIDGKVYAIPSGWELTWMHVRKDLFEKAGILDILPFENEKDVLMAAEKLTGIEPGVYGIGLPLGGTGFDAEWTFALYWYGFGGGFMTEKSSKGVVLGKEPYRSATKRTFAFLKEIFDKRLTPPDSGEWVDISNNLAFLHGRVAMTSNPMSIWYAIMTGKPDLVPKTMVVPDAFPIDLGQESNYIFKSTKHPDLAKDLVYRFFADKEAYRKGWSEQSHFYNLPIFKSQMKVISDAWKEGRYPVMGMDPWEAAMRTKFHEWPVTYPIGEPTSVWADFCTGWMANDMVLKAVVIGESFDKVIDEYQAKAEQMAREAYGR